jgi:F-type H+-transporting ATPase subunit delta
MPADPARPGHTDADTISPREPGPAMSSVEDHQGGVPQVYAEALLALAEERGAADEVLEELNGLAALASADRDFETFLASPLVESEARTRTFEKLLRGRASDLVVDALQVINRKGRLELLPEIAAAYRQEHRRLRNTVQVFVTSAVPLDDALRGKLRAAAARFAGKTPELVESVDPGLLGGMVVRVGDERIDSSVKTRLRDLSGTLLRRASQEVQSGSRYVES